MDVPTAAATRNDVINTVIAIRAYIRRPARLPSLDSIIDETAIGQTMESMFNRAIAENMPNAVNVMLRYHYPGYSPETLIKVCDVTHCSVIVWNIIADYMKAMLCDNWALISRLARQLLAGGRPESALALIKECFDEAYLISGDNPTVRDRVVEIDCLWDIVDASDQMVSSMLRLPKEKM